MLSTMVDNQNPEASCMDSPIVIHGRAYREPINAQPGGAQPRSSQQVRQAVGSKKTE